MNITTQKWTYHRRHKPTWYDVFGSNKFLDKNNYTHQKEPSLMLESDLVVGEVDVPRRTSVEIPAGATHIKNLQYDEQDDTGSVVFVKKLYEPNPTYLEDITLFNEYKKVYDEEVEKFNKMEEESTKKDKEQKEASDRKLWEELNKRFGNE